MLYYLWYILKVWYTVDHAIHITDRVLYSSKVLTHFGQKTITWLKNKPDVIWARNTPNDVMSRLIQDESFSLKQSTAMASTSRLL